MNVAMNVAIDSPLSLEQELNLKRWTMVEGFGL